MLERLKNEPVMLLVVAAAVIVLGLDLAALSETVERLLQLVTLVGTAKLAREQVVPTRKLR